MKPRPEVKRSARFTEEGQWELIFKIIAASTVVTLAIFLLVMHFFGLD